MTLTPFLQDVTAQPAALAALVAYYRQEGRPLLERWAVLAREAGRVVFSGMGTSEFAPEMVLSALAKAGVDATTADAGELLHYPRPFCGMLVLVSQSGESVEPRRLLACLPQSGPLVALTNTPDSSLGRAAALMLPQCAGAETTISAKTYTNTLGLLYLMVCALQDTVDDGLAQLATLAEQLNTVDAPGIERAADLLADARAIHFIARGPALAGAKQAALTFMEGTRTATAAFAAGAFRHGPIELVDDTHRCVFYLPSGHTRDLLTAMAAEFAAKGSHVVVFADAPVVLPLDTCQVLPVPAVPELLFPLAAAPTRERLLDAVARRHGVVAGQFRYTGKVTMEE